MAAVELRLQVRLGKDPNKWACVVLIELNFIERKMSKSAIPDCKKKRVREKIKENARPKRRT